MFISFFYNFLQIYSPGETNDRAAWHTYFHADENILSLSMPEEPFICKTSYISIILLKVQKLFSPIPYSSVL